MTVTDAEVTAALNIWNSLPGTDRKVLRAILEHFEAMRAEQRPTPKSWMELTVGEQDQFARLVGAPMEECAPHYAAYLRGWEAQHGQT